MHWILASFLMFVSSVVLYLAIRKSTLLKTPSQLNNLASFALPLVLYVLLAITGGVPLGITPYQFGIILVLAVFFSYLGNVASLTSIERAPNPGYSLILSKSYVVFTALASIPLFSAALTPGAAVAIGIITAGSALVMIGKPKTDLSHVHRSWLPLAIVAFFCWGMLSLTSKYLLTIGVGVYARLIWSMAIVTMLIGAEMRTKRVRVRGISRVQAITLTVIGVASAAFNYFMQLGFQTAPNIGYVNAVNASSIAAVAVCSWLLFRDELTIRKMVGIVIVTAGLVLLVTGR